MHTIKKYPDGTSYVEIDSAGSPEFTFRVNSYESLWHLNQIVDAYNHNAIRPRITIPNLIDAQADRRFAYNQSTGLKLVCQFLNSMNAEFKIFHPHNSEAVEAMMDNVTIINNRDFINDVFFELEEEGKALHEHIIMMSSDAGGFKPLVKLCEQINWRGETFSASKARSWDEKDGTKFVQQIGRDDFGGKDILIVDDISVFGGTFKGLSNLLRQKNCGKLYLAVSHMTMQNLGTDPVTNYFDKVFTTNSKFGMYYQNEGIKPFDKVYQPKNLQVIKLFEDGN